MVLCVSCICYAPRRHMQPLPLRALRMAGRVGCPGVRRQAVQGRTQIPRMTFPPSVCSIPRVSGLSAESALSPLTFPRRRQRPRNRKENQDPARLEGFISIQLHSRASRFLISHFTIKGQAWLSRGSLPGGAILGPASPSLQPPEGGHSHRPPAGPTVRRPQPTVGRNPERT